jgi:hypothetical protein
MDSKEYNISSEGIATSKAYFSSRYDHNTKILTLQIDYSNRNRSSAIFKKVTVEDCKDKVESELIRDAGWDRTVVGKVRLMQLDQRL